jgi:photosystem II stability/assembly factor-like uncharacterized protein
MGTRRAILALCAGLLLGACGAPGVQTGATASAAATPSSTAPVTKAPPPTAPLPEHPTPWIHMVDADNGWAFTAAGVERTTDGGRTWAAVTAPGEDPTLLADQHNEDLTDFLSATTAWVVGGKDDQYLYRTSDGGSRWTRLAIPSNINDPAMGTASDVVFTGADDGWLLIQLPAAMGTGHAKIYRTADGGQTWTPVHTFP